MHCIKNIYNTDTLTGMLDVAISLMIENDICSCCSVFENKDINVCTNEDLCRAYIFEGLLKKVRISKGKKDKKCTLRMNKKKL